MRSRRCSRPCAASSISLWRRLGGPVDARDERDAVDAPQVSVHKRVPGLRLVRRTLPEPQMPRRVLLPRVRCQKRVLVLRAGLELAPVAFEHVLASEDEPLGTLHSVRVHRVAGHGPVVPVRARAKRLVDHQAPRISDGDRRSRRRVCATAGGLRVVRRQRFGPHRSWPTWVSITSREQARGGRQERVPWTRHEGKGIIDA